MRAILVGGLAVVMSLALPGFATAKNCGDLYPRLFIYEVQVKKVSCEEGNKVAKAWVYKQDGDGRSLEVRGYDCRYKQTGPESGKVRCDGEKGRLVKFKGGG